VRAVALEPLVAASLEGRRVEDPGGFLAAKLRSCVKLRRIEDAHRRAVTDFCRRMKADRDSAGARSSGETLERTVRPFTSSAVPGKHVMNEVNVTNFRLRGFIRRLTSSQLLEAAIAFDAEMNRRFPPLFHTWVPAEDFELESQLFNAALEREDPPGVESLQEILCVDRLSDDQLLDTCELIFAEVERRFPVWRAHRRWRDRLDLPEREKQRRDREVLDGLLL
jgi:hypothetical protein